MSTARLAWGAAAILLIIAVAGLINRFILHIGGTHPGFGSRVALIAFVIAVVLAVLGRFSGQTA